MILLKKRPHLVLKSSLAMLRFLRLDIPNQSFAVTWRHGKRAIPALPTKSRDTLGLNPFRRTGLELLDKFCNRHRRMEVDREMNMVRNSANSKAGALMFTCNPSEICMKRAANILIHKGLTIFRAEDKMNQHKAQRLGHCANYRSGLQPSLSPHTHSWGVAPRCYIAAPLALMLAIAGRKSSPAPTPAPSTPVIAKSAYPPRPTVAPPPFKVFHTTDNSITLVTDANATDDQIAAIIWQLHDAARNNTFAALHFPQQVQQLIAKRDPMIWFHIYRGPKCASEKYTTGALPCGPSYHAAGDYTLGSFSNKNHDDGVLLHAEDKQTELWNPDASH